MWKLYSMENSLRMRRCMRRNYKRSDRLTTTTNFDDHLLQLTIEENASSHANDPQGSIKAGLFSNASVVMLEAISLEEKNYGDEQEENENSEDMMHTREKSSENKKGFPARRDAKVANDRKLVRSTSAVAPGYVPSECDEEIIFELSSLLVHPLRVVQGTFQVSIMFNIVSKPIIHLSFAKGNFSPFNSFSCVLCLVSTVISDT